MTDDARTTLSVSRQLPVGLVPASRVYRRTVAEVVEELLVVYLPRVEHLPVEQRPPIKVSFEYDEIFSIDCVRVGAEVPSGPAG